MITKWEIILRLAAAAALGSVVGIERERLEWAAGLRTHMLVCVGSALAMLVSAFGFSDILGHPQVVLDPSRIAAQVVSGIGFLGAGTILLLRHEVIRGLTTAASLWAVAGVGLAVGGGMYLAAVVATALMVFILAGVKPLEKKFFGRLRQRTVTVVIRHGAGLLQAVESAIQSAGLEVEKLAWRRGDDIDEDELRINFARGAKRESLAALVENLRGLDGVKRVEL